MFEIKEEENTEDTGKPKKGIIKNKEVIAEYDEALSSEENSIKKYSNKLDILKERLGLGGGATLDSEIKTNLIDSDNVVTFIDWKSGVSFFISYFLLLVFFVIGSLVYISFMEREEKKNVDSYEEQISAIQKSILIEEKKVEEGLVLQERILATEYLIDNHVYWSQFFDFIEKNTLESVYYDSFSGELEAEFSFNGTADRDYFNATEQVKLLKKNKNVLNAQVDSFSLQEDEEDSNVSFSLELSLDPEILYKRKINE